MQNPKRPCVINCTQCIRRQTGRELFALLTEDLRIEETELCKLDADKVSVFSRTLSFWKRKENGVVIAEDEEMNTAIEQMLKNYQIEIYMTRKM